MEQDKKQKSELAEEQLKEVAGEAVRKLPINSPVTFS